MFETGNTRIQIDKHNTRPTIKKESLTLGLQKLNENGTVTFIGPDGCGKTWHGLELLNKASKRKASVSTNILRLSSIENLEEALKQSENLIIFYDDIFGSRATSVSSLRRKLNSLEKLWTQMQDNNVKVIVSISSAIFYRYRNEFEECPLFNLENIVEIGQESPDDKMKILNVYFRHFDIAVVENEQHENIYSKAIFEANVQLKICKKTMALLAKTDPSIGFFQCCELFIQNRAFAHYGVEFFKGPIFFLDEELNILALSDNDLEKTVFLILVYVMLKGGSVPEDDLSIANMTAIARDFSLEDVYDNVVQDAIDLLCELYLVKTNETVQFQHKIVLETVFHIFGEMFPSRLIHSCRIDILCQYLRIDSEESSSDDSSAPVFVLSRTVWFDWINRVLLEIRLGNVTQVISHETMYDNLFAVEFVTELLISDQRQFAEKIFLAACEMDSYLVVRHLLRQILKRRSRLTTGLGLTESLVLEGLILASQVESFNVIRVILDKYHTLSLKRISKALHEACNIGNPKSVDTILQQRKDIPVSDISQALFKACRCLGRPTTKQGEHTCKVILRHRKDLHTDQVVRSFREACKRGRAGTVHVFLLEVPSLTSQQVSIGLLDAAKTTRNFKGGDTLKCVQTVLLIRDDLTMEMVTSAYVEACGTWRSELVRLFLRLRGDLSDVNVVKGLIRSANKGHCESISVIRDERPNISLSLVKEGLNESCRCGKNETCNFFLNVWPDLEKEYLHESLCESVKAGQAKQ